MSKKYQIKLFLQALERLIDCKIDMEVDESWYGVSNKAASETLTNMEKILEDLIE